MFQHFCLNYCSEILPLVLHLCFRRVSPNFLHSSVWHPFYTDEFVFEFFNWQVCLQAELQLYLRLFFSHLPLNDWLLQLLMSFFILVSGHVRFPLHSHVVAYFLGRRVNLCIKNASSSNCFFRPLDIWSPSVSHNSVLQFLPWHPCLRQGTSCMIFPSLPPWADENSRRIFSLPTFSELHVMHIRQNPQLRGNTEKKQISRHLAEQSSSKTQSIFEPRQIVVTWKPKVTLQPCRHTAPRASCVEGQNI